ncbi:MAG: hypothetical protein FGM32_03915 [Candidatus Kapabacteria bacterium]|nr:hypothetical protein [Candidatus Kapabacteria bacterium]
MFRIDFGFSGLCFFPMAKRTSLFFMGGGVGAHLYSLVASEMLGKENVHVLMRDRTDEVPVRTLCVWGEPASLIHDAVVAQWATLRFGFGDETIVRRMDRMRYSQYTAASIRALVDATIDVERQIGEVNNPDASSTVSFDSRHDDRDVRPASISLLQHFHGWRVLTDEPMFEPDVATMMDFRVDQSDGVCFVYVLPYGPTEALVECTVFSESTWQKDHYEARLTSYLRDVMGINDYRISTTETGSIAMCDRIPLRQRGRSWIAIGVAGGLTKPTTGYTVARCLRDAEKIMQHYQRTGEFKPPARAHARFDWYDRLLLRIIRDEPAEVPGILWTLFKRNPIERILRFLDEQTDLKEEILIFWRLPWLPFLRAIVRR